MELIISILVTTLISVSLILYFRRSDKRNTQLQTLKTFINTSMNNMLKLFQDKEKELMDKTINLDIALKKLDKASTYINNKLLEIKDSIQEIATIKENLGTGLKEAAAFHKEVDALKVRVAEVAKIASDAAALKQEIAEEKKGAQIIRADIEQARVWAKDSITSLLKDAEDEIAGQKTEFENTLQGMTASIDRKAEDAEALAGQVEDLIEAAKSKIAGFSDDIRVQLDDKEREIDELITKSAQELEGRTKESVAVIQADLETRLKEHNLELEEARKNLQTEFAASKTDFISQAQTLKQVLGNSLSEFNSKWNENIKRFNDVNKEILSKSSDLDGMLKSQEKMLTKKAGEVETAIFDKVHTFEQQISQTMKQNQDRFDSELSRLETGMKQKSDALSGRIEENLKGTETEIRGALQKKAAEIDSRLTEMVKDFETRKTEITGKMQTLTTGFEKQFKDFETGIGSRMSGIEQKFSKVNTDIQNLDERIQREASDLFTKADEELSREVDALKNTVETNANARLSDMEQKISGEMKRFEEEFNTNIRNLNSRLETNTSTVRELEQSIGKFFRDTTDKFSAEVTRLKTDAATETKVYLEDISAREKEIHSMSETLRQELAKAGNAVESIGKDAASRALSELLDRLSNHFFTNRTIGLPAGRHLFVPGERLTLWFAALIILVAGTIVFWSVRPREREPA